MTDNKAPIGQKIAILGTGKMGSAIAARLSETGSQVVLWNRTRSRAEGLGLGTVVDTPADAVRDADIVISSLTGPEAVLAAYLGPEGALIAGAGKHFVDMSTAGPDLVSGLETHVLAAGGTLVDAPILGAPPFIRAGTGAILISGADEDVAIASQVLGVLGTVRHVGPLGSAARLKLVANSMLADVILAAAELEVAGEESGLAADDVFWVLARFVPQLQARRGGIVDDRHEPTLFALRDLRKDLDLAAGLFEPAEIRTPLTAQARQLVAAAAELTPDLDITAVERRYRGARRSPISQAMTSTRQAAAAAR
jgi:3-hydroxyisobutyrate dehydrogenase-like beta-hydroxyacid dehydrogenase